MPLILLPGTEREELVSLLVEDGGSPIDVETAHTYLENYKIRLKRLFELTKNDPDEGFGRIVEGRESLGWKFKVSALKPFLDSLQIDDELIILFGVNPVPDPTTHVILTTSTMLPKLGQANGSDQFGYEYGTSCCAKGKSIDDCFAEVLVKQQRVANSATTDGEDTALEKTEKTE